MVTQLLTLQQVAKLLAVTEQTIENMIRRGEISYTRIGKQYRFLESDINDMIASKYVKGYTK